MNLLCYNLVMAYKDKIYDITALDMAKRLELLLNEELDADDQGLIITESGGRGKMLGDKIDAFKSISRENARLAFQMGKIAHARIRIVHSNRGVPVHLPTLTRDTFKAFQKDCFELDEKIRKLFCARGEKQYPRIKECLPTLLYDMGNAGDIIKHGLLAEFMEWWIEGSQGKPLRIADPFAGCPWGNLSDETADRLRKMENTRISAIQQGSDIPDAYLGSAYLMFEAAKDRKFSNKEVRIHVSDKDEDALCNWDNALGDDRILTKRGTHSIQLMEDSLLPERDGYAILDDNRPSGYDLILIDPYSDFLREEYYRPDFSKRFTKILELVKRNPTVFIAVFILDMNDPKRKGSLKISEWFDGFKRESLSRWAFSLRCPKMVEGEPGVIKGESGFDSEILLISKQIYDRKCGGLRSRLRDFADKAMHALPKGGVVEFWPKEDS